MERSIRQTHPEAIAAITCAIFVFLGWLCLHLGWLGAALFLLPIAYVVGGYESTKDGLKTLFEERELDVDLLMVVAALGAAGLGIWQQDYHLIVDGAILILIFAISGALERIAMQRTERNIRQLMAVTPDTARVLLDDQEQELPIEQLQVGDLLLVKPGELIPTDSLILEGDSAIDQAAITGESLPVDRTVGAEVFGGTLNGSGVLKLRVHQRPESSLIQRVIRLVEQAQNEAPPSQQFIERFERNYARIIIIVGIVLAILPPFIWNWNWETTIYRALIFLVVASPCALMAAIMPTLLSGIANGARQGILFKNGAQLETIGKIRAIAFDKTGTLTTGNLQVIEIVPAPGYSENQVLELAASLEAYSEHPIGKAITQAARQRQLGRSEAKNVQAYAGQGMRGEVDGKLTRVGKQDWLDLKAPELSAIAQQLEGQGKTIVWVAQDHQIIGLMGVSDTIRPEAYPLIQKLQEMGIEQIALLTGDNPKTAEYVARALGIRQVYAQLLPDDKLSAIRQLQQQYQFVAMVGDGINDAPALAAASVGIAMGKTGTDVALETADIVLMSDRLEKLAQAIRLGRRANNIVRQNIIFALGFIGVLLVANFVGGIDMPLGVIGHEGSTVLVTLSGLRLLKS
jgi:Cd2+/Zn2+-exporting ATPase